MDCLAELGGGLSMRDIYLTSVSQWIDGFVDDTSLFTNLLNQDCVPNDTNLLQQALRRDMIAWKDL
jgi:hypothetical protein